MFLRFYLVISLSVLLPTLVYGQTSSRDMEREKLIWSELQEIAPATLADFKAATIAMDANKYDEAERLYRKVYEKAPKLDHVLRRLGLTLVLQGKTGGMEFLEKAVELHRSPENLISLAQALAYPTSQQEVTDDQRWRAYSLVGEANSMPTPNDPDYLLLKAQLALELNLVDDFRQTTNKLAEKFPGIMATHYFAALLAAYDGHWVTAENEIKKAESLGLDPAVVQEFLDSGVHARANVWRYASYALGMTAVWGFGLVGLFGLGKLMSKKTLQSLETFEPSALASSSELTLRKWYRMLINVAGIYYYISIPVVIFLVLAVAASITYGFFMLGRIPIKLVVIICIGALITIYKMVRSLFIKVDTEDPGRAIEYDEAPGLWDLTRRVAEAVGTRPIDEIRVTPGTDMAVYEKGSFRERSQDRARRILIVGVGILNDFDKNAFRAVLAHEYGHFSNRDTAGGDVALRVNNDMAKFAEAMIISGQAVWWNIAFLFLRVYDFIFRRISHGATRLQEVMADRVAASKFGAAAFESGLRHVIRKSVEFNFVASTEINESQQGSRALQNLYELKVADNPDLEEEIHLALNAVTTEDNTHPGPPDRFRLTRKIVSGTEPPLSGVVWDLFKDRQGLTAEMTSLVQRNL